MRRPLIASLALVGVAAVGFAVMASVPEEERASQEEAASNGAPEAPAPRQWPRNPDAEAKVDELRHDGGPGTNRKLAELFEQWAGDEDKVWARRAIVDALLEGGSPQAGLKALLSAIDKAPLQGPDDPLYQYATEKLQELWAAPALFDHGRNRLLTARTDSSRALLGRSLAEHAMTSSEEGGFVDPSGQRRAWLASDIVDAHSMTREPWARTELREGVRLTLGEDVAKVLDDPLGVRPEQLERLTEQLEGMREGAADVGADAQDAALLDRVQDMDLDELVEEAEQPRPNPHRGRGHRGHRPPQP